MKFQVFSTVYMDTEQVNGIPTYTGILIVFSPLFHNLTVLPDLLPATTKYDHWTKGLLTHVVGLCWVMNSISLKIYKAFTEIMQGSIP